MSATITSITGLQNLINLQQLYADYNSLSTVDVSGLTNLVTLDVNGCEVPGVGNPSLTSVTLTGCTALEQLLINDSDFSAGLPNFTGLNAVTYLDIDNSGITGDVDLTILPSLTGFDLSSNTGITSVIIPESPISDVNLYNTALTETAVNNILQWLDGSQVSNGYVDLSAGTSAIPTGNGIVAKNSLISKGWTVNVNQGPPANVGIAASSDFDIVGDFTIEMFVNMSNLQGFPRPYSFGAYPAPNAMSIENGTLYFWGDNAPLVSGSFAPNIGQWYHICATGVGSTVYLLVNGVQIGSAAYDGAISSQNLPLTIGFGNEANSGFNGLMSNFRWTNSYVYDPAGFTVPTSTLTDLTATKLLIFQGTDLSSQITDNSGNGHNATNSGATYSANNPFAGTQGSLQMGNL